MQFLMLAGDIIIIHFRKTVSNTMIVMLYTSKVYTNLKCFLI